MSTAQAIEIMSKWELADLVHQTVTFLNIPVGSKEHNNSAIAAAHALQTIDPYLKAVRECEERRAAIGVAVGEELTKAEERRADNAEEADRMRQAALRQMGDYGVQQHFFTICAGQIRRLLPLVHQIVGVEMDPNALAILDSYQPLRNQFEHLDERLPGHEKGGRLILDVPDRMLIGLNDDGCGRITVKREGVDVVAAVNLHGVEELERIVSESHDALRPKCYEHLETFFDANPDLTEDLSWLRPTSAQRVKRDDGTYD